MNTRRIVGTVGTMRTLRIEADDGVAIAAQVLPNPSARVRVVVSHGNGLAAHGYRVFWESLCRDHEVVLHDLRGHGRSERGARERHTWAQLARDCAHVWAALPCRLGRRFTVGALHSLSAVASLLHLQSHGPGCDALVLFDPSLPPPAGHPLEAAHRAEMALRAERALRRRVVFENPAQLASQFARTDVFGTWRASAPLDMARATLREDAPGRWSLCCEPEREAAIYLTNTGHSAVWRALRERPCPIHIVGGDPYAPGAHVPSRASRAAHDETGVSYEAVGGSGHFLQLEQPERCREALVRFVESLAGYRPNRQEAGHE
jgi:pimeloyl-ACP methyl ester carboxylesterase